MVGSGLSRNPTSGLLSLGSNSWPGDSNPAVGEEHSLAGSGGCWKEGDEHPGCGGWKNSSNEDDEDDMLMLAKDSCYVVVQ